MGMLAHFIEIGEKMVKKTKKLYEEIADGLIKKIQSGELAPGDRLPSERVLAQEYGVSRSVIREAFRSLARLGCVESYVGGGTFVKAPEISDVADPLSVMILNDEQFALELVEVRLLLETEIARLAALKRSDEQLQELSKTLRDMSREVLKGNKGEEQDIRFHELLAKAAGNRAMEMVFAACMAAMDQSMGITQYIEGVPQQTLYEHENILDAVVRKDGAKAEDAMKQHLESTRENLTQVYYKRVKQ